MKFLMFAIVFAACIGFSSAAQATYYKSDWKDGSEIIMQDVRWAFMSKGTYFSIWNGSFYPVGGSYYGGVSSRGPGEDNSALQNTNHGAPWTFWSSPAYKGATPKVIYISSTTSPSGAGGEGSAASAGGRVPFIRHSVWFTMCRRTWKPIEGADQRRYDAWWIKDNKTNRWHLRGVLEIPAPVTGYKGTSTFVEALAPPHLRRSIDVRRNYYRFEGKWHSAAKVILANKFEARFAPIEGGAGLRLDQPVKHQADPKGSTTWTLKQPAKPVLDQPAVDNVEATVVGNQLAVRWAIPQGAAPQLGYKIEAFSAPGGKGKLVASKAQMLPFVRLNRLDATGPVASVRVTITDIFDQTITKIVSTKSLAPVPVDGPESDVTPGLRYEYFEAKDANGWKQLPDFDAMIKSGHKPIRTGFLPTFDDRVREGRGDNYAIRFNGWINAPSTGLYVFDLRTHDGSVLKIDGRVVTGTPDAQCATPHRAPVVLAKGLHRFELAYFKTKGNYRGDRFAVTWAGPGFARRSFVQEDLRFENVKGLPNIKIAAKVTNGNRADIVATVASNGSDISRVDLFWGDLMLGSIQQQPYSLNNVLLPNGKGEVWARLVFDDGRYTLDAPRVEVIARDQVSNDDWTRTIFGETGRPFGLSAKTTSSGHSVSIMGEALWFGHQILKGDFVLSGRIANLSKTTKTNGVERRNWIGFYAKSAKGRGGSPTMNGFFGVYRTSGNGMRATPMFPDLGGGRVSEHAIKADHDWLKLERLGTRFVAYTSPDGNEWTKVREAITNWKSDVQVGITFRSQPHKNRTWTQAAMDHIRLTVGPSSEAKRVRVAPVDIGPRKRVTGVVQSLFSPAHYYSRVRGVGVLKSVDGSTTWNLANGNLKDAPFIRSVAVHPKNPSVILVGIGRVTNGKLSGGLYKSTDAGKAWRLVSADIDFDGVGPSSLLGEVISFDPQNPSLVTAGGESTGVYVSTDGGDTWTPKGMKGQRISCLQYNPAKLGMCLVGTFPDAEFAAVGLGKPTMKLAAHIYGQLSRCDGGKPRVLLQDKHFGVTNLAFDVPKWGFVHLSSSCGIYYTYNLGAIFQRQDRAIPIDMLYTALGSSLRLRKPNSNGKVLSKVYAAPFSASTKTPIFMTQKWGRMWEETKAISDQPQGVSAIACDVSNPDVLIVADRKGLLKSSDGGRTYRRVFVVTP